MGCDGRRSDPASNYDHHNDKHHNDKHHNDKHHNDKHHNDKHHNDDHDDTDDDNNHPIWSATWLSIRQLVWIHPPDLTRCDNRRAGHVGGPDAQLCVDTGRCRKRMGGSGRRD